MNNIAKKIRQLTSFCNHAHFRLLHNFNSSKFMKKFLVSFALASLLAASVNAQGTTAQKSTGPDDMYTALDKNSEKNANREKYRNASLEEKKQILQNKEKKLDEKAAKYNNASPEEKARMDAHREMMQKLSPEQREAVKKERERHRAAMKSITGVEMPTPPSNAN